MKPTNGADVIRIAPTPLERHFTPKEIAEIWRIDENTVRRIFQDEPGVLRLGNLSKRGKRAYVTLRIPAAVLERVYRQRVKAAA
jgi:hypothetical protein